MERPASAAEAGELLRGAAEDGRSVGIRGGGTKLGSAPREPDTWLSTVGLTRVLEHNAGDLTAVLEAGVRLADAQRLLAQSGQMLALDPPLGPGEAATVGGVVAAADAGPRRHRYGAARDLLLGVRVALTDGTVARAGGKVIKNVAGYDLAKLFAGSRGTLGLVAEVVVRLHPLPEAQRTVVAEAGERAAIARLALGLAAAPLELESLDVRWEGGRGALLARVGGVAVGSRAEAIAGRARAAGAVVRIEEDDEHLWAEQRERQRDAAGLVLRVSALPADLERVLTLADRFGGSVVGRAGLGLSWLRLPATASALGEALRDLCAWPVELVDAPPELRVSFSAPRAEAVERLEARVRARFDPAGVLAA